MTVKEIVPLIKIFNIYYEILKLMTDEGWNDPEKPLEKPRRTLAVSYTHLDVYKRQDN